MSKVASEHADVGGSLRMTRRYDCWRCLCLCRRGLVSSGADPVAQRRPRPSVRRNLLPSGKIYLSMHNQNNRVTAGTLPGSTWSGRAGPQWRCDRVKRPDFPVGLSLSRLFSSSASSGPKMDTSSSTPGKPSKTCALGNA